MRAVYPNGAKKAFTLRFDDGPVGDYKMVGLLEKYGLRATFYISAGKLDREGYVKLSELSELYRDHEIANHTYSHRDPRKIRLTAEELRIDLTRGKDAIAAAINKPVVGYGYVCSSFGDLGAEEYKRVLRETGHTYAVMGRENRSFVPDARDMLDIGQSFRFSDPELLPYARDFVSLECDSLTTFFAMAHTYEFDRPEFPYGWDKVEELFKIVSGRDDIWYTTNGELFAYLDALSRFEASDRTRNDSSVTLYLDDGTTVPPSGAPLK